MDSVVEVYVTKCGAGLTMQNFELISIGAIECLIYRET
jgi:hypothetical protein